MKPKKGDIVETLSLSRMFGRIERIVNNNNVQVRWNDGSNPKLQIIKIKDLALVAR
jgi:hypothetical protein